MKRMKMERLSLEYLVPGTYCIQETGSSYGYTPDDRIREFVVSEDGRIDGKAIGEIRITNTLIEIWTQASDKADGDKIISPDEDTAIVDKVFLYESDAGARIYSKGYF